MRKVVVPITGTDLGSVGALDRDMRDAVLKRATARQITRYRRLSGLFGSISRCFEEAAEIMEVDLAD